MPLAGSARRRRGTRPAREGDRGNGGVRPFAIEGKLSNEQFRSRAPADVVSAEEERRASAQTRLDGLRRALSELM